MPREIISKVKFERTYHCLSEADQRLTDTALKEFGHYLQTGSAPVGLGIKHLGSHTYEFRVSLALRVVYVLRDDQVILSLLGTHDEVRRFLKHQ